MRIELYDNYDFKSSDLKAFVSSMACKKLLDSNSALESFLESFSLEMYLTRLASYIYTNYCDFVKKPLDSNLMLEVMLVDSNAIRELNREYLNKDYATDVLSFPLECITNPYDYKDYENICFKDIKNVLDIDNLKPIINLGSIVINIDCVLDCAKEFKHNIYDEITLLFTHALLHILGFDHEIDNGEQRIIEREILKSLDIQIGLIDRVMD